MQPVSQFGLAAVRAALDAIAGKSQADLFHLWFGGKKCPASLAGFQFDGLYQPFREYLHQPFRTYLMPHFRSFFRADLYT